WIVVTQSDSTVMLAVGLAVAGLVAVGLFLLMARLIRIHEVREIMTTVRRRGSDASGEAREVREESVIEASPDRFGDFKSSGDSPTVIRPPSPSIEGAAEENAGSMAQAKTAHGVEPSDIEDNDIEDNDIEDNDIEDNDVEHSDIDREVTALPAGTVL